jgi:hypothetical protein
MMDTKAVDAYIAALENARDEAEQFHANKLMAAYELAEITLAQLIAHLNHIG